MNPINHWDEMRKLKQLDNVIKFNGTKSFFEAQQIDSHGFSRHPTNGNFPKFEKFRPHIPNSWKINIYLKQWVFVFFYVVTFHFKLYIIAYTVYWINMNYIHICIVYTYMNVIYINSKGHIFKIRSGFFGEPIDNENFSVYSIY